MSSVNIPRSNVGGKLLSLDDLKRQSSGVSTNTWAIWSFLLYIMIGLGFYCFHGTRISALDCVYFSIITFCTIGYGDIPVTDRGFTSFYVLLGAGLVAAFFGLFSGDVLEAQERAMKTRMVKVALKMDEIISSYTEKALEYHRKRFDSITGELIGGVQIGAFDRLTKLFASKAKSMAISKMNDANMAVFDEELREIKFAGLIDVLFILGSLFSGALCMIFIEKWTFNQGVYWASATITTVGYGDVHPVTVAGKIFCIFYALICCSLTAKGFRSVVCYPLVLRAKLNERLISEQFNDDLTEETLKSILYAKLFKKIPNMQRDRSEITKAEFSVLMLSIMGKVQEKDILLVSKIFDRLDTDEQGFLSEDKQLEQMKQARLRDQTRIAAAAAAAREDRATSTSSFGESIIGSIRQGATGIVEVLSTTTSQALNVVRVRGETISTHPATEEGHHGGSSPQRGTARSQLASSNSSSTASTISRASPLDNRYSAIASLPDNNTCYNHDGGSSKTRDIEMGGIVSLARSGRVRGDGTYSPSDDDLNDNGSASGCMNSDFKAVSTAQYTGPAIYNPLFTATDE